jgi:hypothetical protein
MMETPETKPATTSSGGGIAFVLGIVGCGLAVIVLGFAIYLFVELRGARKEIGALQARVGELGSRATSADKRTRELDLGLSEVRGQTSTIAERAGVTEAELQRTAAAARQLRDAQRKAQGSLENLGGEVVKVKDDVAASKAAIEETLAQLQRVTGDLGQQSGLIARNAEELEALKRQGLREYFEFDVRKAKTSTAIGPVAIQVKNVDVKRHKFNMVLVVDDLSIEKKDKTLLEPVQFYRRNSRQLHEIVVYQVQKDRITGYLSTPKVTEAAAVQ